jgi:hypothetical protein
MYELGDLISLVVGPDNESLPSPGRFCQYSGEFLAVGHCDGEGGMAQGAGWLDTGDWFPEGDAQTADTIGGHEAYAKPQLFPVGS